MLAQADWIARELAAGTYVILLATVMLQWRAAWLRRETTRLRALRHQLERERVD